MARTRRRMASRAESIDDRLLRPTRREPSTGTTVAKFINHVMVSGKKSVAERIVYGALSRIEQRGQPRAETSYLLFKLVYV